MTQEEEMIDALNLTEIALQRIKKHPPQIKFAWWSTGKPLNLDERERHDQECKRLEELIQNARAMIKKGYATHWSTVDDTRDAFYLAESLSNRYVERMT